MPPSPLAVKLAAAIAAGGAALLSYLRLRRRLLLSSLRLDLLRSLPLGDPRPPSLLVTGFRSHGKSALVNTLCRVLAAERGPLVVRSPTAYRGPAADAQRHLVVVPADVAAEGEGEGEIAEGEGAEVEIVEVAGMPPAAKATTDDVEAGMAAPTAVDCVVAVVRCGAPPKERRAAVRRLSDVAGAAQARGLHLVVVLTQRKALNSAKQAGELRREVCRSARTDCVYFIENYTADSSPNLCHPVAIKNDFHTHLTALAIVRQCVEFAKLHRNSSLRNVSAGIEVECLPRVKR